MEAKMLNEIRKKAGMSIDELSKKAQLPKSTVEKVLFGIVQHPRIDTLQAIERALGIDERTPAPTGETAELLALMQELTEEELQELSSFVDFIISKRK